MQKRNAMKWLKDLFRKENKMSLKEKSLEEIEEFLRSKDFQWLKGDQMGNIERYQSIEQDESTGMIFVKFASGGRMNVELIQDYMDIFPAQKVDYESKALDVPKIPKLAQTPKEPAKTKNTVSAVELEDSPIYTLLKKQKPNWVNVSISLKLNLPTKNLHGVLTSSFEDAEREIVNYVTEGIDIEDIRAALADSILAYYDKKKNVMSSEKIMSQNQDGE
jgi:hypothetical protein